jgi:hypothetical protein
MSSAVNSAEPGGDGCMQQEIDQLKGRYIVCGWGRVGRQVVENL